MSTLTCYLLQSTDQGTVNESLTVGGKSMTIPAVRYITTPAREMADMVYGNIAYLLNTHNKLKKRHTYATISSQPNTTYITITRKDCYVIASVGITAEQSGYVLKHLVVDASYRRKGFARFLLQQVLQSKPQNIPIWTYVRNDNWPSIQLMLKNKFNFLRVIKRNNYCIFEFKKD